MFIAREYKNKYDTKKIYVFLTLMFVDKIELKLFKYVRAFPQSRIQMWFLYWEKEAVE